MSERHIKTIKPSRVKYLSSYLTAVFVFLLLVYINTLYPLGQSFLLVGYGACFLLLVVPEILRHKDYHKITDRNIVEIKAFGQSKRSILHSFVLDIHVHQNPVLKYFLDIGALKIEAFSGYGMEMLHIKRPHEVAKTIENLMITNQRAR